MSSDLPEGYVRFKGVVSEPTRHLNLPATDSELKAWLAAMDDPTLEYHENPKRPTPPIITGVFYPKE